MPFCETHPINSPLIHKLKELSLEMLPGLEAERIAELKSCSPEESGRINRAYADVRLWLRGWMLGGTVLDMWDKARKQVQASGARLSVSAIEPVFLDVLRSALDSEKEHLELISGEHDAPNDHDAYVAMKQRIRIAYASPFITEAEKILQAA
jgi:hypothetical protein